MLTESDVLRQRRSWPHGRRKFTKRQVLAQWKEQRESAHTANNLTSSQVAKDKEMAITAQESTFTPIDEGVYVAGFFGWEEAEDKGFGPGIKLIWTFTDERKDNGDPLDIWQFCSQKLTPKSALWNVMKGLGRTPTLGTSYELDELLDPCIGTEANLTIKHVEGGKGPRAKVTDVTPLKVKR